MRVTVESGTDTLVFHELRLRQHGDFWIADSGIEGLTGTVKAREEAEDIPQQDGAYFPSRFTQGGRTITIHAEAVCDSSVQLATLEDRLNALFGQILTILVDDAHGLRTLTGYLADDPAPVPYFDESTATFSLIVFCPDPLKYGRELTLTAANGVIEAENNGNAPTWPRFTVTGALTALEIHLNDLVVSWTGNSNGLALDFRDMNPSAGTIQADEAFPIPPGVSQVKVVTTPSSAKTTMSLKPAWR